MSYTAAFFVAPVLAGILFLAVRVVSRLLDPPQEFTVGTDYAQGEYSELTDEEGR